MTAPADWLPLTTRVADVEVTFYYHSGGGIEIEAHKGFTKYRNAAAYRIARPLLGDMWPPFAEPLDIRFGDVVPTSQERLIP